MVICFSEPTIDELLADSLTQGLMRADGVNATALRSMLYGVASSIENRPALQHDRISPIGGVLTMNELAADDMAPFERSASPEIANPSIAC